jgi:DNA-binding transcriptional LysR family regulator
MNSPDPELLKVLIAFQESKNLIQAAERLKISQPAVTQRLQRLQEQVSQPLYALAGRKKVLTHFGKALYELASETFHGFDRNFENLNRRYAQPENLVLRVGGQKELLGLFSDLIAFPGRIDHRKMNEEQALEALHKETIDVALSASIVESSEFISRRFFESPSRIIFHRKFFPSLVNFRDLQEHLPLLKQSPCALNRLETSFVADFCRGIKTEVSELNTRATFEDWHSVLSFVENGGGYAIVPGYMQSQARDLREIDIPHAIIQRSNYYAIFQKKLKRIDSFKQVLNFVVRSS